MDPFEILLWIVVLFGVVLSILILMGLGFKFLMAQEFVQDREYYCPGCGSKKQLKNNDPFICSVCGQKSWFFDGKIRKGVSPLRVISLIYTLIIFTAFLWSLHLGRHEHGSMHWWTMLMLSVVFAWIWLKEFFAKMKKL